MMTASLAFGLAKAMLDTAVLVVKGNSMGKMSTGQQLPAPRE